MPRLLPDVALGFLLESEAIMRQWLTVFPQQAERMQDAFAKLFLQGAGGGTGSKE